MKQPVFAVDVAPRVRGSRRSVVVALHGDELVTGGADGRVKRWLLADGSPVAATKRMQKSTTVRTLAVGKTAVFAGTEGGIVRAEGSQSGWGYRRYTIFSGLSIAGDGRVAASSRDGLVRVWRDESLGDSPATFSHHGRETIGLAGVEKTPMTTNRPAWIVSVTFSPDGKLIASGGMDGFVCLSDATSGALLRRLEGYRESAFPVAFSRDGALVAAGSYDRAARVWGAADGALRHVIRDHDGYVFALQFLPDGSLVTGAHDGRVRRWDLRTNALGESFEAHVGGVSCLTVSDDGALLATGGYDGLAKVWTWSEGS